MNCYLKIIMDVNKCDVRRAERVIMLLHLVTQARNWEVMTTLMQFMSRDESGSDTINFLGPTNKIAGIVAYYTHRLGGRVWLGPRKYGFEVMSPSGSNYLKVSVNEDGSIVVEPDSIPSKKFWGEYRNQAMRKEYLQQIFSVEMNRPYDSKPLLRYTPSKKRIKDEDL